MRGSTPRIFRSCSCSGEARPLGMLSHCERARANAPRLLGLPATPGAGALSRGAARTSLHAGKAGSRHVGGQGPHPQRSACRHARPGRACAHVPARSWERGCGSCTCKRLRSHVWRGPVRARARAGWEGASAPSGGPELVLPRRDALGCRDVAPHFPCESVVRSVKKCPPPHIGVGFNDNKSFYTY